MDLSWRTMVAGSRPEQTGQDLLLPLLLCVRMMLQKAASCILCQMMVLLHKSLLRPTFHRVRR